MADSGSQDRIDIALGADTSGLDDAERRSLAFVNSVEQQVRKFQASGQDIGSFFTGVREGITAEANAIRAELGKPLAFHAEQALNTSDALIAKLGLVTRSAATARAALSTPIGPPPSLGPTLLASQQDTRGVLIAEESRRSQRELSGLRDVMLQEGQTARVAAGSNVAAAESIAVLGGAATRGAGAMESHHAATRRAASAIGIMAAESVGASSPLARLAEAGLLFGGGEIAILAVAGAVLVAAKAYEFFTKGQREAKEATDKNREALQHLKEVQQGPVVAAQTSFETQRKDVERLKQSLADLTIRQREAASVPAGRSGVPSLAAQNDLLAQRKVLLQELAAATDLLGVASKGVDDAVSATHGAELLAALKQEVQAFGLSEIAARKLAITLDHDLKDAQKATALGLLDTLGALQKQRKEMDDLIKGVNLPDTNLGLDQAIKSLDAALAKPHKVSIFLDIGDVDSLLTGKLAEIQQRQREASAKVFGNIALPATDVSANFDRAAASVDDVNESLTRAAAASNKFFARALRDAIDTRTAVEKLNDGIHDVTSGLDAVVGAAHNIGLIGDEAANAIGSVLSLGDAIGNVIEKASAGNILGLVGAGIGVLGSLLGKSALEQEHDRILAENNQRLRELSVNLERTLGLGAAANAQQLAAVLAAERVINAPSKIDILSRQPQRALDDGLRSVGLTLAEFERIVKDQTGLEILDSKGHLVAATLEQADAALKKYIETQTRFNETFAEQTRRLDLGSRLRGEPQDAASSIAREVAAAAKLSPAITDAFKNVDFVDQAAVRQAFLGLFNKFDLGQLTAEDLGLSKEDFLKFLDDGAGFLDDFNNSVLGATKNLLNVPDISTLAELEFRARSPINRPGDGASLPPFVPDISPITDAASALRIVADFLKQQQAKPAPTSLTQNITGPINVNIQGKVDDPAANARAVRAEFTRTTLRAGGREGTA